MAIQLKFWSDSALTTPVSVAGLTMATLGSSTLQLFLGAVTTPAVQWYPTSSPSDPVTITPTNITPEWEAATVYVLNARVKSTSLVKNGFKYRAATIHGTGTTGATQPTWPTTIGQTVADMANGTDGVTWECEAKIPEALNEIKLAATEAGLNTAVAGEALELASPLLSGLGGKREVWIKITDAMNTPSVLTELRLQINELQEIGV